MNTIFYRKIGDYFTFILTDKTGKVTTYKVNPDHKNYEEIKKFASTLITKWKFEDQEVTDFINLVNPTEMAKAFVQDAGFSGRLKIEYGNLYYDDHPLSGYLIDRILQFQKERNPELTPLVKFLENLMENPSFRVHDQLFRFLEKGNVAFTPDGCFLAYKYVNENYTSVHDGKTMNKIGEELSMPRYLVNDDPDQTCSTGLHCCSNEYLGGYQTGRRVLVVKVNPRDVVSVPSDYDATKMRCCKYFILGELTREEVESDYLASRNVIDDYEDDNDYWYEDERDYDDEDDQIEFDILEKREETLTTKPFRDKNGRFIKGASMPRDKNGRFIKS